MVPDPRKGALKPLPRDPALEVVVMEMGANVAMVLPAMLVTSLGMVLAAVDLARALLTQKCIPAKKIRDLRGLRNLKGLMERVRGLRGLRDPKAMPMITCGAYLGSASRTTLPSTRPQIIPLCRTGIISSRR